MSGRRILITGCEGYLARMLISRLHADKRVEAIFGVDIKERNTQEDGKFVYGKISILDPKFESRVSSWNFDTVVHCAWTFNPTHDFAAQDELDLTGTRNVLSLVAKCMVKNFVYLGSTTAYGAIPENPSSEPFLKEKDWISNRAKRMFSAYRYARNKALIDYFFQEINARMSVLRLNVFWTRAAIVLGPNTRNVVSYVAESPFTFGKYMFRVKGYDPPMQFLSEGDMVDVLYRATMEGWRGVANVAGGGAVRYSELIKILGRKELVLPVWLLYPLAEILWRLRILKFPASLIDLIRYPWVADISRLRDVYDFEPRHSSEDALWQFAERKRR